MLQALDDLQRELQLLGLWSTQAPSAVQLASTQPFCIDTLGFEQWLQWVFIPGMRGLAARAAPLPGGCQIQPMGEQALRPGLQQQSLLLVLGRIDQLASGLN